MQLQDLENSVLLALQEPNVNFGSQAVYPSGANFPQSAVDFMINRAYGQLLNDIADVEIASQTLIFPSVSQQYAYAIPSGAFASGTLTTALTAGASITGIVLTVTISGTPITYTCVSTDTALSALAALAARVNASTLVTAASPTISPLNYALNNPSQYVVYAPAAGTAGNSITFTASSSAPLLLSITASGSGTLSGGTAASPAIRFLRRVWYQPLGLTYQIELEPGARLVSWQQFQRASSAGYLQPFAFALQPDVCSVSPDRSKLYFFPGPFTTGDTITIEYAPTLTSTSGITPGNFGYLVNSTDVPAVPEPMHDLIWMLAVYFLWPKARELGAAMQYLEMYKARLQEEKQNYMRMSMGDSLQITGRETILSSSGWQA